VAATAAAALANRARFNRFRIRAFSLSSGANVAWIECE
jgi:hypothetical protein